MRIGLAAIWIGLLLAQMGIVTAFPALRIGAVEDAEMAGALLHGSAGLVLLGLAVMMRRSRLARSSVRHPLVLVASALGGWSLMAAPFAHFPLLSVFGPPQTSQGALWSMDVAVFVAGFAVIGRLPKARRFHLLLLSLVAVIAGILHLRQAPVIAPYLPKFLDLGWSPLTFSKYLAYYSVPLLMLAVALFRRHLWIAGIAFVAGIVSLVASSNLTAGLIVAMFGPVTLALLLLRRRWPGLERARTLTVASMALCVVIGVGSYPLIRMAPPGGELKTLWSRGILGRAIEPALAQPLTLLAGKGWGHYPEESLRHLSATNIRLYNSDWEDLNRDEFHTHNAVLEGLFSAGVIGALLTLLAPVALIMGAQVRYRIAAVGAALSLATLDALWFQTPMTVPAGAMVAGFLAARRRPYGAAVRGAVVAALLGVVLLAAAMVAALHAVQVERWKACLSQVYRPAAGNCPGLPWDPRQSRLGEASVLSQAARDDSKMAEEGRQSAAAHAFLRQSVAQAAAVMDGAGLVMAQALNNAYGLWMTREILDDTDRVRWGQAVAILQHSAPRRPDLIIPYVSWLLTTGREAQAAEVVERSALEWPDHPVVQWFRGVFLLGMADSGKTQKGLDLLRQAIAGGVENYMPVPDDIKALLGR